MKTLTHTDQTIIEMIIKNCNICFLGVVTPLNSPYVIPMNFGYLNNVLYFHGAPEGQVIDCLNINPNICVTSCTDTKLVYQHPEVACSYRMHSYSVIAFGKVSFVKNMREKCKALNIIMKHYSHKKFEYGKPALSNVKIWKVPIDEVSCKEFGHRENK